MTLKGTINNLAWVWGKKGHTRLALALAKLYRRLWPADTRGFRVLAQAYQERGDAKAAEGAIRSGLRQWPDSLELLVEVVRHLLFMRRLDEAADAVDELARRHPNAAELFELRAALGFYGGDLESVPANVEAAIERAPADTEPYFLTTLGMMLLYVPGQRKRAEEILRDAASRTYHGDPKAHMVLALLDWDRRPKTADAHLVAARQIWPGSMARFEEALARLRSNLETRGILAGQDRE